MTRNKASTRKTDNRTAAIRTETLHIAASLREQANRRMIAVGSVNQLPSAG